MQLLKATISCITALFTLLHCSSCRHTLPEYNLALCAQAPAVSREQRTSARAVTGSDSSLRAPTVLSGAGSSHSPCLDAAHRVLLSRPELPAASSDTHLTAPCSWARCSIVAAILLSRDSEAHWTETSAMWLTWA